MSLQPTSEKRLARSHSRRVCAALAEVLPSDRYCVGTGGMGHEGIEITDRFAKFTVTEPTWYFDNTYGGDDGYTDHLRVYLTTGNGDFIDDHTPDNKPAVDADPITIANFIWRTVTKAVQS